MFLIEIVRAVELRSSIRGLSLHLYGHINEAVQSKSSPNICLVVRIDAATRSMNTNW